MKKIILTILLWNAITAFAQIPTIGLINRWNFDGNLNNEISTGVNLDSNEYVNFGRDRFGNPNGALYSTYGNGPSVGGTGNSVNIPQGLSTFTISFWMYCRPNDNVTWFSFGSNASNKAFIVQTLYNSATFTQITTEFIAASRTSVVPTTNGKWRNIILSYNGSELQIYEGNTFRDAFMVNLGTSGFDFKLFSGLSGAFNSDSERLIDDLYFYNRILTGVEKTQLAAQGNNCNNYFLFKRIITNASTANSNDGNISFSVSGPAYPIVANLLNTNNGSPVKQITFTNSNNFIIDSLEANNYKLSLVDLIGSCNETSTFTIGVNPTPPCDVDIATTLETTDASSSTKCDGYVKFDISMTSGGQPTAFRGRLELKYLTGVTNFGTKDTLPDSLTNLCAGNYKAIITAIGNGKEGEVRLTCADTVEFTIAAKTTSLNETILYNFNVYPNPATKTLSIESNTDIDAIQIFSLSGVLVKNAVLTNNTITVDDLTSGIYLIKVTDNKGYTLTRKFVKQ